jgi:hypothetical protein
MPVGGIAVMPQSHEEVIMYSLLPLILINGGKYIFWHHTVPYF